MFLFAQHDLSATFNSKKQENLHLHVKVLIPGTRVVRRQRSSPRGNQIKIETFSECHSKFKVKRSEIMVWYERSCHKEYTCEI